MPRPDNTARDAAILADRFVAGHTYAEIAERHGISESRARQIASDPANIRSYLTASFDLDLLEASLAAREVKGTYRRAELLLKLAKTKDAVGLAPAVEQPVNPALLDALAAAQAGVEERQQREREDALRDLITPSRRPPAGDS